MASPADLSGEGVALALPLRRETSQVAGFIVLAGDRGPSRSVELALEATLDELGLAVVDGPASDSRDGRDAEPVETGADPRDLVAGRLDQR